jgi:hypothetical protein
MDSSHRPRLVSIALVAGLGFVAPSPWGQMALAHGPDARLVQELDWRRPQIERALAVNRSELGLNGWKVAAEVQELGGQRCAVGALVALDVDDAFAFDIDETVHLTVTYMAGPTTPFNVAWERNGGDGYAVGSEVVPEPGTGLRTVTFRLPRARLAGQGIHGTDIAIGAGRDGVIALCDVQLTRPDPQALPAADAPFSLTVLDDATGEPVPARVGLYASDSGRMPLPSNDAVSVHRFADEVRMQWLTPKGAWPLEHRSIFHIAGRYAAKAAAGTYDLVVTRGPEFRTHRSRVQLAASGPNDVVVRLERYEDMPGSGWYSGESHVHLMRERTEDMDVWNLLAAEDLYVSNLVEMGNITTTYFPQPSWGREGIFSHRGRFLVSGQEDPRTVMRGHTLHWNTGVHAHLEDSFFQYHTVFEKTRATGAVTGYAHRGEGFNGERGLATDVPFGLVEFIEVLQSGRINTDIWYSFLNLGYRISPAGGADYPYIGPTLPGIERTYAKVDGPVTPERWLEGFRAGRVFVTNGPLLRFTVNGQESGSELRVPRGTKLTIAASAALNPDVDALDRLEVVVLGDVAGTVEARGRDRVSLQQELVADRSLWVAVRALGRHQEPALNTVGHSAPVYVVVDDEPTWKREEVPALVERQRRQLTLMRNSNASNVDPMGDLEAWETKEKIVSEWQRQLPLLEPRIEEADRRYVQLLERWQALGSK